MAAQSKNMRVYEEYTDRIRKGDLQAVYDFFAPDFHTHVTRRVAPEFVGTDIRPGEVMFWEESANAFSNREFFVEKFVAVDAEDIIVVNWSMTGTHDKGTYFGAAPTGNKVELNGTAILRLKDGKFVEHWGGPHCMHAIGLLAGIAAPTKLTAEQLNVN